ncbi:MAG: acyl-CoA thioesterase [Bacteroidales bacterium]|nr:acyl-CoA thioesterase [Bacteroidales bacterium]
MNNTKFNFLHSTPVQIRFNDIDIMAHVNNSVYQNFFDLARTHYFEKVFQTKMEWKKQALVLAKITIEYFNPIFLEENIEVKTKVHRLGNKSLQMIQEIINVDTKEIKAQNDAVLVAFGINENKPVLLPELWKVKIQDFEEDIKL